MKTELPIYIRIAEEVEALTDTVEQADGEIQSNTTSMLSAIQNVAERAEVVLSPLSTDELTLVSQHIKGHSIVEVPGKYNRSMDAAPKNIVLP